ncbi:MAG: helix-turn-helix domain-containing protein [Deltaproteobacteria bacterium]|jgi:transcriptional regulator with XRE-family HTH domain|nr:helix-turn-helix domain-containing protein [Deltaproteobacteria bacterium]
MKIFGETVRGLRNSRKLSLRELASKAGISPAYLSRIEHGKEGPPSPEIIKEICNVLDADPDDLFPLTRKADPDIVKYLNERPRLLRFIRFLQLNKFSDQEIDELISSAEKSKEDNPGGASLPAAEIRGPSY